MAGSTQCGKSPTMRAASSSGHDECAKCQKWSWSLCLSFLGTEIESRKWRSHDIDDRRARTIIVACSMARCIWIWMLLFCASTRCPLSFGCQRRINGEREREREPRISSQKKYIHSGFALKNCWSGTRFVWATGTAAATDWCIETIPAWPATNLYLFSNWIRCFRCAESLRCRNEEAKIVWANSEPQKINDFHYVFRSGNLRRLSINSPPRTTIRYSFFFSSVFLSISLLVRPSLPNAEFCACRMVYCSRGHFCTSQTYRRWANGAYFCWIQSPRNAINNKKKERITDATTKRKKQEKKMNLNKNAFECTKSPRWWKEKEQ